MKINSIAAKAVLSLMMVTLFSYAAYTQAITKSASIPYTNGVPAHTPSSVGSEIAINTVNKDFYLWNGSAWVKIVFGAGGNVAYTDVANTFTQNQIFTLPTLTGSSATNGINITQTWNTTGAPNLIYGNVTPTAFATTSYLLNLQVNGNSRFRVSPGSSSGGSFFFINADGTFTASTRVGSGGVTFFDINNQGTTLSATSGTQSVFGISGYTTSYGAGSANFRPLSVAYTLNNSGAQTGTATGIFLNATETLLNGMTHNLMDLQVGGVSRFRVNNLGATFLTSISTLGSVTLTGGDLVMNAGASEFQISGTSIIASGTLNKVTSTFSFSPTSGTGVFNHYNIAPTINQTGGANGITRGLFINPTLTSAADFRSIEVNNGRVMFNQPSLVSQPAQQFTGAWYTGGTATTTKPHVLIEPALTTSTNWNSAGTGLGINAASGFSGNLLDLQLNGASRAAISQVGSLSLSGGLSTNATIQQAQASDFRWNNRSRIFSDADNRIRFMNSSLTDFERLQFGGITSSFSALSTSSVSTATAAFTSSSSTITTTTQPLLYRAGDVVIFTNSGGALPSELVVGNTYYVVGSPTATTVQVSNELGGAAITFAGVGTGTHTVTRVNMISLRNAANTAFIPTESLYQRFGAGSPEGVVTAPVGATYNRTDGGAGTSFYVKESGTGSNGWIAK